MLTLAFPFAWVNSLEGDQVYCVLGGALITFIEPEPLCFFCGRTTSLGTTTPSSASKRQEGTASLRHNRKPYPRKGACPRNPLHRSI